MESGLAITHLYNLIYEAQGLSSPPPVLIGWHRPCSSIHQGMLVMMWSSSSAMRAASFIP